MGFFLGFLLFLLFEEIADLGEEFFLAGAFGGRFGGGRFGRKAVDELDRHEDGEGDDGEIDDRLDKRAVTDGDGGGTGDGVGRFEGEGEVFEIHPAGGDAEERHDDVIDEAADDFAEGGADDHTDGEIDHVTAHGEGFEFGQDGHGACFRWCGESIA